METRFACDLQKEKQEAMRGPWICKSQKFVGLDGSHQDPLLSFFIYTWDIKTLNCKDQLNMTII